MCSVCKEYAAVVVDDDHDDGDDDLIKPYAHEGPGRKGTSKGVFYPPGNFPRAARVDQFQIDLSPHSVSTVVASAGMISLGQQERLQVRYVIVLLSHMVFVYVALEGDKEISM